MAVSISKTLIRRSLTFANVVAVLALTISLTGGVYAAAKINGKDIKNQSIAGKKLKKDAVTGKQVQESSLKGFASASDSRRIRFEQTVTGNVSQPVLKLGTLRLSFRCVHPNYYELIASSTSDYAGWDLDLVTDGNSGPHQPYVTGGLLTPTPTPLISGGATGDYLRNVGTLVYNSDTARETITVHYAIYVGPSAANTYCNLAGTATRVRG